MSVSRHSHPCRQTCTGTDRLGDAKAAIKKQAGLDVRDPVVFDHEIQEFRAAFNEAQALLRTCTVAFIEIPNPLEQYLFEAYCAMELDTAEWNTFRTH